MKNLRGVYLVIDPTHEWNDLLLKLKAALEGGVNIVQVWNHWGASIDEVHKLQFIAKTKELTDSFDVPLLMHDDWQLAQQANMDGVHFDKPPNDLTQIGGLKFIGITVGNDFDLIRWAASNNVSYISFCAIFPSSSVDSCDLVDLDKIKQAREIIDCPIFLSGGLTINNLYKLKELPFDGIAVISGILNAENPKVAVNEYIVKLKEIRKHQLNS